MQVLFAWKSEGLSVDDALQHWTRITTRWQQTYQLLVEQPLRLATTHAGTLFLGLLAVPDLFRQWQEFYTDETHAVAWAGLAHNLLDLLPQQRSEQMNRAFVAQLETSGDHFLRELDGRFVVSVLDRKARRLRIIVNNYGLTPCFWTTGPYGIAAGTRIAPLLELAGRRIAPNRTAFAQMFAANWCFGTQTSFEGAATLSSGREIVLQEHAPFYAERCCVAPEFILEQQQELGPDYLDIGSEAFTTMIARQLRHANAPLMNLTGGIDSRTIAATIVKLGHQLPCDVSGLPHTREIQLSARVAEALQVQQHCFFPGPHYLEGIEATLRLWSLWTEGMVSAYHEFARSAFALSPKLRQFYAAYRQTFSGVGGGMGKNFYYHNEMLCEQLSVEEVIQRVYRENIENEYLTQADNDVMHQAVRAIILEETRLGLRTDQLFDWFYWRERVSRWGGYILDMQQIGRHAFAPICQPRLLSVFFCMSVKERLARAWHLYHLRRVGPELLTIPFIKPPILAENIPPTWTVSARDWLLRIHPGLYKFSRSLKETFYGKQRKRILFRDAEKAEPYFHPYLKQLLFSKEAWWPEVIAYQQGQRMWARYVKYQEAIPIWTLASIELWAKTFLAPATRGDRELGR